MPTATRDQVKAAIDSELDWMHAHWGEAPHEIDAWVSYVTAANAELIKIASSTSDSITKLAAIRKVAGVAAFAMEQNGAPLRT